MARDKLWWSLSVPARGIFHATLLKFFINHLYGQSMWSALDSVGGKIHTGRAFTEHRHIHSRLIRQKTSCELWCPKPRTLKLIAMSYGGNTSKSCPSASLEQLINNNHLPLIRQNSSRHGGVSGSALACGACSHARDLGSNPLWSRRPSLKLSDRSVNQQASFHTFWGLSHSRMY